MDKCQQSLQKEPDQTAVFLDLSKVFDTVSLYILFVKLEHIIIRGIVNDWVLSYLDLVS